MKIKDEDILALKRAKEALLKSSSARMAKANLDYLYGFFVLHPPEDLKKYWQEKEQEKPITVEP